MQPLGMQTSQMRGFLRFRDSTSTLVVKKAGGWDTNDPSIKAGHYEGERRYGAMNLSSRSRNHLWEQAEHESKYADQEANWVNHILGMPDKILIPSFIMIKFQGFYFVSSMSY